MAKLRFRVEINKGGVGVSMSKLASVTAEIEKFLQMLVSDIAIEDTTGKWIAKDFDNNSVDFTSEYVGLVTIPDEHKFNEAVEYITADVIAYDEKPAKIGIGTILQYANIAKTFDADEAIRFGLYNGRGDNISLFRSLSKQHALEIQQALKLDDKIQYLGGIQGVIHSIITERKKGAKTSFRIRELYSDNLVTCYYNKNQYNEVVSVLEKQGAVVHIQGWITASRAAHKTLYMEVEKIEPAVEYRNGDLDKFIGLWVDKSGDSEKAN